MKHHYIGYPVATVIGLTLGLMVNQQASEVGHNSPTLVEFNHAQNPAEPGNTTAITEPSTQNRPTLAQLVASENLYQRMEMAQKLAANSNELQISALLEQLSELESDKNLTGALSVFYLRLATINPQGSLDKFHQLLPSPGIAQKNILYTLYHHFAAQNLPALLD